MMHATFLVDDRGVEAMFDRLDGTLSHAGLAAFLGGIVDPYLRRRAAARFRSEGDDVTGPWAPLRQNTVVIRESLGYPGSHPINRRTGELERYITQQPGDVTFASEWVTLTQPRRDSSAELQQKIEMAQTGHVQGSRNTPSYARPVIGMGVRDLTFITAELAFFIARGVAGDTRT